MSERHRGVRRSLAAATAAVVLSAGVMTGCAASHSSDPPSTSSSATTDTSTLPGASRPSVTIGDKNYTEQFILGELYDLALKAQGYAVSLNDNIGPTAVTYQALTSGRLDLYPEYINTWNASVAGDARTFPSERAALTAARAYAARHGFTLLTPTPFADTYAVASTAAYAAAHGLRSLGDLAKVAPELTFGAPTELEDAAGGLPAIEYAYGFTPHAVTPLDTGVQYQALSAGAVQAAFIATTDGELSEPSYRMLSDPLHIFGWGNVVPVIPTKVLAAEGPDFAATIERVDALLTTKTMRQLNADVDVKMELPADVAQQFLQAHGLAPPVAP